MKIYWLLVTVMSIRNQSLCKCTENGTFENLGFFVSRISFRSSSKIWALLPLVRHFPPKKICKDPFNNFGVIINMDRQKKRQTNACMLYCWVLAYFLFCLTKALKLPFIRVFKHSHGNLLVSSIWFMFKIILAYPYSSISKIVFCIRNKI